MRKKFHVTGNSRNIEVNIIRWQKFPDLLYFGLAPLYTSNDNVT